jgi:hypothetical protein
MKEQAAVIFMTRKINIKKSSDAHFVQGHQFEIYIRFLTAENLRRNFIK